MRIVRTILRFGCKESDHLDDLGMKRNRDNVTLKRFSLMPLTLTLGISGVYLKIWMIILMALIGDVTEAICP